jgi:hypothetical protein
VAKLGPTPVDSMERATLGYQLVGSPHIPFVLRKDMHRGLEPNSDLLILEPIIYFRKI